MQVSKGPMEGFRFRAKRREKGGGVGVSSAKTFRQESDGRTGDWLLFQK